MSCFLSSSLLFFDLISSSLILSDLIHSHLISSSNLILSDLILSILISHVSTHIVIFCWLLHLVAEQILSARLQDHAVKLWDRLNLAVLGVEVGTIYFQIRE